MKSIGNMSSGPKITARMFFELMGWPKEALNENLKKIINDYIGKTAKILREDYAEPEKVENTEKMFLSHAEVEIEFSGLSELVLVSLNFGPSVVEIIHPKDMILTANMLQDVLADVVSKVQELDTQVKVLAGQANQYASVLKKLEEQGILKKPEKKESPSDSKKTTENDSSKIVIE